MKELDRCIHGKRVVPHGAQLDHEILEKEPVLVHVVVAVADRVSPVVDAFGQLFRTFLESQEKTVQSTQPVLRNELLTLVNPSSSISTQYWVSIRTQYERVMSEGGLEMAWITSSIYRKDWQTLLRTFQGLLKRHGITEDGTYCHFPAEKDRITVHQVLDSKERCGLLQLNASHG